MRVLFHKFRKKTQLERQMRWVIWVIIFLLVGAFATCTEAKYVVWGRSAEAYIFSAREKEFGEREGSSSRNRSKRYVIHYRWNDPDDGEREDKMTMHVGWQFPEDRKIKIDYIPGEFGSRIAGRRDIVGPLFFFVPAAVLVGIFAFWWWKGSSSS